MTLANGTQVNSVSAVDGPPHAAHQCCHLDPDGKLLPGALGNEANRFDSRHSRERSEGPEAPTKMQF